jgi:RNA polymerase sigma-70 factor, ECF subfamily
MNNDSDRTARFVSLFAAYNRRIYALVRAMVHNRVDADDVFQEICSALWKKFDQFQPGTNFWSWACAVTRLEALRFLRQHRVHARLFTDAFYEAIEQRAVQMEAVLDLQQDALADCYAKLTANQRQLLDQMYLPEATAKSVATSLGRSTTAIYKALRRAHKVLFDCIQERLKEQQDR